MVEGLQTNEDLEDIYGPRPDGWMHPASLVFAIFGRPAGNDEDKDLSLKMTGGITGGTKRKEVDPGTPESEGEEGDAPPRLSTKHLQLMNGGGGKSSRAEVKKVKHEVNSENKKSRAADADADLRRRAFEAMSAPRVESKTSLALCASVQALTEAVVSKELLDQEEAKRKRWDAKVLAKEKKLAMWERRGKGESREAVALLEELEEMYDNPVVAPLPAAAPPLNTPSSSTPSLAGGGGQEGAAGGGGDGRETGAHDTVGALSEDATGVGGGGSGAGAGEGMNNAVEVAGGEVAGVGGTAVAGVTGDLGVGVNEISV